ncbi:universal stress protein [Chloroflexota bacterium]
MDIETIEEWPFDAERPPTPDSPGALNDWPIGADAADADLAPVIRERIVEEERQRLDRWVDLIQRSGVQVSGKMLYGTPFLEIIREVLRNKHDLLMITAEGRGGLKEMLFGSTAMHLMRKCPCPVWVVRHTQPAQYTRILAAVDPAPLEEEHFAVNVKIMDLATSPAQHLPAFERCAP